MVLFLLILISTASINIYLSVRSMWVFRLKREWNKKIYNYRVNNIVIKGCQCETLYQRHQDAISSYSKILFGFRWNIESYVEDRELFEAVMGGCYEE